MPVAAGVGSADSSAPGIDSGLSTQDSSTVCCQISPRLPAMVLMDQLTLTFRSYSFVFSLNSCAASALAGLFTCISRAPLDALHEDGKTHLAGLGSLSRL